MERLNDTAIDCSVILLILLIVWYVRLPNQHPIAKELKTAFSVQSSQSKIHFHERR